MSKWLTTAALHQPAGTGYSKSKLSRRIALLEERLESGWFSAQPGVFSVTEIGQTYYEHCNAMLIEAEAAQGVH